MPSLRVRGAGRRGDAAAVRRLLEGRVGRAAERRRAVSWAQLARARDGGAGGEERVAAAVLAGRDGVLGRAAWVSTQETHTGCCTLTQRACCFSSCVVCPT